MHAHIHLIFAAPFLQIISVKEWRDLWVFPSSLPTPPSPQHTHIHTHTLLLTQFFSLLPSFPVSCFLLPYSFLCISPFHSPCLSARWESQKEHLANTDVVLLISLSHHPLRPPPVDSLFKEALARMANKAFSSRRKEEEEEEVYPTTFTTTHSLHPSPPSPARLSHARKCYSDQELHVHVPLNQ